MKERAFCIKCGIEMNPELMARFTVRLNLCTLETYTAFDYTHHISDTIIIGKICNAY